MKRGIKHNTHPGEILRVGIIEDRGLTITKAAEMLDVTVTNLSDILNGKAAITQDVALKIQKAFGGSASLWIRLQASYDLRESKRTNS